MFLISFASFAKATELASHREDSGQFSLADWISLHRSFCLGLGQTCEPFAFSRHILKWCLLNRTFIWQFIGVPESISCHPSLVFQNALAMLPISLIFWQCWLAPRGVEVQIAGESHRSVMTGLWLSWALISIPHSVFPSLCMPNGKAEVLRILTGKDLEKNWKLTAHSWYSHSFQGFHNCLQTSRKQLHWCCKGHLYVGAGSTEFALPLPCRCKPIYATKPSSRSN